MFDGSLLGDAFRILGRDRRGYVATNIVFFVSIVLGMEVGISNPELQEELTKRIGDAFLGGATWHIISMLQSGNWISAILSIFVLNLFLGSLVYLTLPGIIFFAGVPLLLSLRGVIWGIVYSPTSSELARLLLFAIPTMVLEGEAYCLIGYASFKAGKSWLLPHKVDQLSLGRRAAFGNALSELLRVYTLAVLVLLLAAVVEVAAIASSAIMLTD